MSESRPPLFFNFNGGLLSSIFSKNHSKCLKTHAILSMQLQPGRVLYAVKNDPPVEYSISFITNTL